MNLFINSIKKVFSQKNNYRNETVFMILIVNLD